MRIFKNTRFSRFAQKESIRDKEMVEIVDNLEAGHFNVDLGGGVFKIRLARSGEGKSGGYRVILFFKSGERTFYIHGFAKSETENINKKELIKLKKQAKTLFAMTEEQIEIALKEGVFEEIKGDK